MAHSVLVVEDEANLRAGIAALLRIKSHTVNSVASVAEAMSHLDRDTPTHVLLDLNLHDGPGTHILRRIRNQALPIRVALLTGASDTALLDEARALSVDAVFIKPPDWDELLQWFEKS